MSLTVTVPASSTDLTTLTTVKSFLGITDSASDTILALLIKASSDAVVAYCKRTFAQETIVETLEGSGRSILMLERTPVVSITRVKFDGTTMPLTEISVEKAAAGFIYREAGFYATPFLEGNIVIDQSPVRGRPLWEVTYVAGYSLPSFSTPVTPLLPSNLELAAINTVVSLFKSKDRDLSIKSEKIADVYSATYDSEKISGQLPESVRTALDSWVRIK